MVVLEVILFFYVLFSLCGLSIRSIPAVLVFPVAPFLCAWEIRRERPFVAWTIIVLWALLYALALMALVVI